jgi:DNA-binding Xre family transcriptional regulator
MTFRELMDSQKVGFRELSLSTGVSYSNLQRIAAIGRCTNITIERVSKGLSVSPSQVYDALLQTRAANNMLPEIGN